MIFYDKKQKYCYDNGTNMPGTDACVEITEDANNFYHANKDAFKINLDNVPGDKITLDGIKQYGVNTEALRVVKLAEINAACEAAIYAGFDLETEDGVKHFSLTNHDQMEIAELSSQDLYRYLYHADGEPYRLWSKEEFDGMCEAAYMHKATHRLKCNNLRQYIKRVHTNDELFGITYDTVLPVDLQGALKGITDGLNLV